MNIQVSAPHGHLGFDALELELESHRLRCDWPKHQIDAMIGFWEFTQEFLEFKGPKVFYCCEPSFYFKGFRGAKCQLRSRLATLREDEFAWHYHPQLPMRVPHFTIGGRFFQKAAPGSRLRKAAAMVSNLGHPLARNRERQKRVEFLVNSGCDIYGARANWERFQLKPWSRRQAPASYKGPCENKYATLAGYHACICLENSSEPLYFTEKLPDAIRAGCVPIYHSHLSVRESFLQGAIWVDPAEYDWDLGATLEAALRLDREEVDQANQQWLATNPNLLTTILLEVYRRLAEILAKKSSGEIALPGPARRLPGPWPM